MPVDPQLQMILNLAAGAEPTDFDAVDPASLRTQFDGLGNILGAGPEVGSVEDRTIDTSAGPVPVRIYQPAGTGRRPAVVHLHGGGWVIGSIDSHDLTCRQVCSEVGAVVVSVGYRLAPEHPFPAALDDCLTATRWVVDEAEALGIDPDRVAVMGDSAGGNLAAVTTLLCRDDGGPGLACQVLLYPVTDSSTEHPSKAENAEGYFLTLDSLRWFTDQYVPSAEDRLDPRVSPLLAPDLRGLPPALVVTAEFDPLRDEGLAYAERLSAAGVKVASTSYAGAIHGFLMMSPLAAIGQRGVDEVNAFLRDHLA